MRSILKWSILIFLSFLGEQFSIDGFSFNFSFLIVYLFVINYLFPSKKHKKIAPIEIMIVFFIIVGLIQDLIHGIVGPSVISKTITGFLLLNLAKQIFFQWTDIFKAFIIYIFTVMDDGIYSLIMLYFFDINIELTYLVKSLAIKGLVNIPIGLILTWRKP